MPPSEADTEVAPSRDLDSHLQSDARALALFFFFALLDETMAVEAAERAMSAWKASSRGSASAQAHNRVHFVRVCKRRIDAERALQRSENRLGASAPGGEGSSWKISDPNALSAWIRFAREASDDEVSALVLTRILKLSEADVAAGLATSLGALRNRVGRAARALGAASKARVG